MKDTRHLVVGLSPLGEGLVQELVRRGCHVYAADRRPERVERLSRLARCTLGCFDATQEAVLEDFLDDKEFAVGFVAISDHFLVAEQVAESLARLRLPRQGGGRQVQRILAVADLKHRARILQVLGHEVVEPVPHAASSLAVSLAVPAVLEFHRLGLCEDGEAYGAGELEVPAGAQELNVADLEREVPGVRYLGLKRRAEGALREAVVQVQGGWRLWLAGPESVFEKARRFLEERVASQGS